MYFNVLMIVQNIAQHNTLELIILEKIYITPCSYILIILRTTDIHSRLGPKTTIFQSKRLQQIIAPFRGRLVDACKQSEPENILLNMILHHLQCEAEPRRHVISDRHRVYIKRMWLIYNLYMACHAYVCLSIVKTCRFFSTQDRRRNKRHAGNRPECTQHAPTNWPICIMLAICRWGRKVPTAHVRVIRRRGGMSAAAKHKYNTHRAQSELGYIYVGWAARCLFRIHNKWCK